MKIMMMMRTMMNMMIVSTVQATEQVAWAFLQTSGSLAQVEMMVMMVMMVMMMMMMKMVMKFLLYSIVLSLPGI